VLQKFKTEPEAGAPAETDEELIVRVSRGDAMAYEILVNRYQKSALQLALRFTRRQTEAEDRAQEAFLRVHSHAYQYNPKTASFKTWFFAILSNLCRNAVRRDKSLSLIELTEDALAIGDPEGELANEELRAALAAAIAKLPSNQRLALILRYEEGFRYAEIAAALGVSISAVRARLARAKRTLGRELVEFKNKSSGDRNFLALRVY
jgi:RNA polymerase sigma-70 factor, ECF subfamily